MNQAQIGEAIVLGFIALLVVAAKFFRRPCGYLQPPAARRIG